MKVSVVACKHQPKRVDVMLVRARACAEPDAKTIVLPVRISGKSRDDNDQHVPGFETPEHTPDTAGENINEQDAVGKLQEELMINEFSEDADSRSESFDTAAEDNAVFSQSSEGEIGFISFDEPTMAELEYCDEDETGKADTDDNDDNGLAEAEDLAAELDALLADTILTGQEASQPDEYAVHKPVISMRYFHRDSDGDKVEVSDKDASGQEIICVDGDSGRLSRICGFIKRGQSGTQQSPDSHE